MIVTCGRSRRHLRDGLNGHVATVWIAVRDSATLSCIDGSTCSIRLRMRGILMMVIGKKALDGPMPIVSKTQL